jgi:hypothetical protein
MYYNEDLIRNTEHIHLFEISEPNKSTIIPGRSRSIEGDVYEEECRKDNIE